MTRMFTGRHMAAILIAFFAVVLAVNLLLARLAGATFGGVVVDNSYVASQHFNRWLDASARESKLGWSAATTRRADGRLTAVLTGVPDGARVSAIARHPLGRLADRQLDFAKDMASNGDDTFVSTRPLPEGRWRLRLEVTAGAQTWRSEEDLR